MSRFVTAFERAEQEAGLRRETARETPPPAETSPAADRRPAETISRDTPAGPEAGAAVAGVGENTAVRQASPVVELPPADAAAADRDVTADLAPIPDLDSRRNGAPIMAPSKAPRRPKPPATRISEQLVSLLAPASFEAEQYRVLRHRVEQFNKSAGLSIIAVSSPTAAEGKTTTAINLAGSLAQAPSARVLLVDADLRGPSVAYHLALEDREAPGLVEAILDDRLTLDAVVQVIAPLNVSVLPAGRRPAAPYEVLQSPRMGELMEAARSRYDFIIIDTPPLVSVPDCRVIGKWVDGFLVVVAAHRTTRKLLEEALRVPEPGKVLGLVFNGDDHHFSRDYYTYPSNGNGARWPRRKR